MNFTDIVTQVNETIAGGVAEQVATQVATQVAAQANASLISLYYATRNAGMTCAITDGMTCIPYEPAIDAVAHVATQATGSIIPILSIVGVLAFIALFVFVWGPDNESESKESTPADNDEFIVIGVTGRKRSGKDTVGKYLIDNYGFVRVAYADALKEACKIIFGFSDEQVYGDDLKEVEDEYWKHSPREVLQKVGTELFRERLPQVCTNMSNDIWIRSVDRQIQNLRKQGYTRFVITDVRFPNELDFIAKYNGKSWKVQRPSIIVDPSIPVHASEAMIDEFKCDTVFVNDGSLQDLYQTVENEIEKIFDQQDEQSSTPSKQQNVIEALTPQVLHAIDNTSTRTT